MFRSPTTFLIWWANKEIRPPFRTDTHRVSTEISQTENNEKSKRLPNSLIDHHLFGVNLDFNKMAWNIWQWCSLSHTIEYFIGGYKQNFALNKMGNMLHHNYHLLHNSKKRNNLCRLVALILAKMFFILFWRNSSWESGVICVNITRLNLIPSCSSESPLEIPFCYF